MLELHYRYRWNLINFNIPLHTIVSDPITGLFFPRLLCLSHGLHTVDSFCSPSCRTKYLPDDLQFPIEFPIESLAFNPSRYYSLHSACILIHPNHSPSNTLSNIHRYTHIAKHRHTSQLLRPRRLQLINLNKISFPSENRQLFGG